MKEEIIKLLEAVELKDVEENDEYYSNFKAIKEDFQYAINEVKECDEDEELYKKIKEKINLINEQETDFRKYRMVNSLSRKIIVGLL